MVARHRQRCCLGRYTRDHGAFSGRSTSREATDTRILDSTTHGQFFDVPVSSSGHATHVLTAQILRVCRPGAMEAQAMSHLHGKAENFCGKRALGRCCPSTASPYCATDVFHDSSLVQPTSVFLLQPCTFKVDYTLENVPGREFGSVFLTDKNDNLAVAVVSSGWSKVHKHIPTGLLLVCFCHPSVLLCSCFSGANLHAQLCTQSCRVGRLLRK